MSTKRDIKELEKQCLEAEKIFKTLQEQLAQAMKEEEEAKKAKLAAEKQKRYDAVVSAYEKFEELRTKYVDDYGSFTFKTNDENFNWVFQSLGLF